jgi:ATP-dependent Clp endopeptidase proteolytic subunit ClpP
MTNIKKGFWLEAKPAADEDEDEDSTELENIDNSIFFYSPVTKKSCLELNKKIKKLTNGIVYNSMIMDAPLAEIKLHINSGGGSLLDCFSTVDTIRKNKVPIHSVVEGSAASAATLMSVVSQKRSITKHSFMLIHQLSSGLWGKFEDLKDDMQNSQMFMDTIYKIYEEHTKIPKNTLKEILKRDIYFDAKTCLKYGLVDKILE